jgi:hypothetical protein
MKERWLIFIGLTLATCLTAGAGTITVLIDHNENDDAAPGFRFLRVPSPATNNAATGARFTTVAGEVDSNSGGLEALQEGRLPDEEDEPHRNFFFAAGTPGGAVELELKKVTAIWQINTYSWHGGSRAPQLYKIYGATGAEAGFNPRPPEKTDPTVCGWTFIANVDTRPKEGDQGGQYGVSVRDSSGKLGDYRYLLLVCAATETTDDFGNTFYSEIDVLDHPDTGRSGSAAKPREKPFVARTPDGKYEITIDFSGPRRNWRLSWWSGIPKLSPCCRVRATRRPSTSRSLFAPAAAWRTPREPASTPTFPG